jgi:hypothetical protein
VYVVFVSLDLQRGQREVDFVLVLSRRRSGTLSLTYTQHVHGPLSLEARGTCISPPSCACAVIFPGLAVADTKCTSKVTEIKVYARTSYMYVENF